MLRRRIPGRRGDGVRLGRTRWRSLPPFVSAWTRIKTLKTRLLIASVLQAASAILYAKRRGLPARRRFASLDPISNALQITS